MRRATLVVGLCLAGCVAAPLPEDEWVGEYDGAYECSDGSAGAQTIIVDQHEDGRIFINGRACDIPLTLVSDDHAVIPDRWECETVTASGDIRGIFYAADLFLTGSFLEWFYDVRLINRTTGEVFDAVCAFEGRRVR